jgi:hypothetical protein
MSIEPSSALGCEGNGVFLRKARVEARVEIKRNEGRQQCQ